MVRRPSKPLPVIRAGWRSAGPSLLPWAGVAAIALAAVAASHLSIGALGLMAGLLLVAFGLATLHSPRVALAVVALVPLVDRYLIARAIPTQLGPAASLLSEALLAVATVVIGWQAVRSGSLSAALRHPLAVLLAAFLAIAAFSAWLNQVPVRIATEGVVFTVDAMALFFLPRMTGYREPEAWSAMLAFVGLGFAAAILAMAQVVLDPGILGLTTWAGRFGEGLRPGSFLSGMPNMLGAVLALGVPFCLLAAVGRDSSRPLRATASLVGLVLLLTLFYTFSRGAWIGLAAAVVLVGAVVEWRALGLGLGLAVLAFVLALVIPRGLLLPPGSQWAIDLENAIWGRAGAMAEGDQRVAYLRNALPIIGDHPVLGTGPGRYGGAVAARYGSPLSTAYTDGRVPTGRTVDNYWLHALVEFGIAGSAVLAAMLAGLCLELIRVARQTGGRRRVLLAGCAAAAVVMGIDSLVEMLLEGNTTSLPLWFLLGVGSVLAARTPRGSAPSPSR